MAIDLEMTDREGEKISISPWYGGVWMVVDTGDEENCEMAAVGLCDADCDRFLEAFQQIRNKPILEPSPRQWMFYHDGVYGPAEEQELRDFGKRLGLFSDQKGMASDVMKQMWEEIDKLRAENAKFRQNKE